MRPEATTIEKFPVVEFLLCITGSCVLRLLKGSTCGRLVGVAEESGGELGNTPPTAPGLPA